MLVLYLAFQIDTNQKLKQEAEYYKSKYESTKDAEYEALFFKCLNSELILYGKDFAVLCKTYEVR